MQLIDEKGQPRFGVMDQPVEQVNFMDFDLRSVMDKPRSKLARHWRFNQFQFISAAGPDWLLGLAVVDLKIVSSAFIYVFDFRTGAMREASWLRPLAAGTGIEPLPETGGCHFRNGATAISITGQGDSRQVDVAAKDGLSLSLRLTEDRDPLRVCSPAGYNGWVYTRKSAGLAVGGHLRWDDLDLSIDAAMRGSIDWSCGFMRRETAWNWACLAGVTADGCSLGLNLASGVNETGVTENALWLDGVCIKLDMARFEFDRYNPSADWRVTTSDGRVALRFKPEGVRQERRNAWVLASNFRQFAGTFSGTVTGGDGQVVRVDGLRGLMEDHFARW
ncbi:MAG: hypothetical protein CL581_08075 [Alteromonadaceae bacterium]|nr:hypothetical protein [Alteromonadaceae bacterium]MBH84580.1 hypothetical protein [Alteromonadaceae bacterium]|tara:strand:- start:13670 stop:14668 length:999 start_codon:yes stop_codon:yes gene_type:complete